MKNRQKCYLKSIYGSSKKKNNSSNRNIKKDIETVLKLNIQNYPSPITDNNNRTVFSYYTKNINSLNNNEINKNNKKQTDDISNTLAISIRKLKTFYPNIKDEVFNENYANGQIPARTEHIKIEENYKLKIGELTQNETKLKKKQENLEKEIQKLDNIIDDQELSIEVINNVDNNTSNLQKIFTEKVMNEMKEKDRKANYLNSKEFQEQLNLFLLREEYNSTQKMKEIRDSIKKNKNLKIAKIEELNQVNDSLKKLHDNKKEEVEELYMHYLNILKEGKDTRSEGLSWIIREIFNLDKKVIISFFPKFLDKLCIKYLFDITHINMNITEIEKQLKLYKKDFKAYGIINELQKNNNNDFLTQRNMITQENLQKIKKQFIQINSYTQKKTRSNKKNCLSQNSKTMKVMDKIFQKNSKILNSPNDVTTKSKIKSFFQDDDDENKKDNNNLPYLLGDPNHFMNRKDEGISKTNKFIKNEIKSSIRIPPIIKLKDFERMSFIKNFFTQKEITKVNGFYALRRKLEKLREDKEILKTNEMDRIFKEFQRNNYEQKYNVNKIRVISALIGEDNIQNELFRQERREKLYNEQISKSQLFIKNVNRRSLNDKSHNNN